MKITKNLLREMIKEELAALKEDNYNVPYEVQIIRKIIKTWHALYAVPMLRTLETVPNYTENKVDPTILKAAIDGAEAMIAAHKKQAKLNNVVIDDIEKKNPNRFKKQKSYGLNAKTAAPSQKDVSDVMPNLKKSGENLSNKEYNKALYQYVRTKKIVDGMKNSPFYDQELSDLRKQRAALLKMRAKDPTLPEPPPIG